MTNEEKQIEEWELEHEVRMFKDRVRWFFFMFFFTVVLLGCSLCHAYTLDQWADTIRITEGNPNYGVISPKFHNKRQVCKNTVLHAWRAYRGNRSDLKAFIIFLANRYCPKSVDPIGNRNWKHNMEVILCVKPYQQR